MQWITLHGILDKGKKLQRMLLGQLGKSVYGLYYIYIYIYQLVDFINDKLLKNDSSMVFLFLGDTYKKVFKDQVSHLQLILKWFSK